MIEKILIANRGEIALRILRACHEMGIKSVAVHSTADDDAMHVRLADESICIGPPAAAESYLNVHAILSAATISNADAIHPGYGFLSENGDFAAVVEEHGFTFIGPSPNHIRLMGDKIAAKKIVKKAGIPVVPGSDGAVTSIESAVKIANEIGYPVLIKASSGGGGRGMKIAKSKDEVGNAFSLARSEAQKAFGDNSVYIEKFLMRPRHIEIQVLADHHGNVVHLGERDCSLQRRHQKLLEEAPSPALNSCERVRIGEIVAEATRKIGYRSVGTVEFLFEDGEFYFIEMNTRLQVEHPVTEIICGLDLVREMIRVSSGAPLSFTQDEVSFSGHAIECRINAEHPSTFLPSPGKVGDYHAPGGLGVRIDSAIYSGYHVPPHYDSMIAKLIVHGSNRNECLMRLKRALAEYVIDGLDTTIPLHQKLLESRDFVNGEYDIHWLETFVARTNAGEL
ncbi:MAG: acetyl-CoA carboxylase biotin carboxylase subunit [Rhodospirillaceae bacterium TMED8]|nr:acetyl-CoA carboxylase biotin carboxylase subunit [Magnetovibrio sp.]OUT51980.1 MAG: acetyl-CoA carboxylase biotin carboxylase subunit [Rhodospirillaceae bacterium TMED8]|tara:strand:+ start:296 stop:1651 length:1356 start_codon:yes stop_codon:yes gene_type:complete